MNICLKRFLSIVMVAYAVGSTHAHSLDEWIAQRPSWISPCAITSRKPMSKEEARVITLVERCLHNSCLYNMPSLNSLKNEDVQKRLEEVYLSRRGYVFMGSASVSSLFAYLSGKELQKMDDGRRTLIELCQASESISFCNSAAELLIKIARCIAIAEYVNSVLKTPEVSLRIPEGFFDVSLQEKESLIVVTQAKIVLADRCQAMLGLCKEIATRKILHRGVHDLTVIHDFLSEASYVLGFYEKVPLAILDEEKARIAQAIDYIEQGAQLIRAAIWAMHDEKELQDKEAYNKYSAKIGEARRLMNEANLEYNDYRQRSNREVF